MENAMNSFRRAIWTPIAAMAALVLLSSLLPATPAAAAQIPVGAAATPAINAAGFELRSELNNKCLEILSFNANNGAEAGMWDCWGGANQRWYWDGQMLRNEMNNKCLEILYVDPNNFAKAGMWDCWGGANQRWRWDGRQLRSDLNNKCLEVLYIDPNNGARAGMYDCWGGANQRWYS